MNLIINACNPPRSRTPLTIACRKKKYTQNTCILSCRYRESLPFIISSFIHFFYLIINTFLCNCLYIGLCNNETKPGIFRRKSSNVSSKSRLAPIQSSSCPTSPRQGLRKGSKSVEPVPSTSAPTPSSVGLHRSASTISSFRPRSSPAGLYSYTGF